VHRAVILALACLLALAGVPFAGPAAAAPRTSQSDAAFDAADVEAAGAAARELSRLEAARDFEALYDLMHPDARGLIPRAAVVGWYEQVFTGTSTEELTVTGVESVAWTWGVTGHTYPRTAAVAFVQPYVTNGVGEDVVDVVHLVAHDSGWGWFLGETAAFVNAQIARYAPAADPIPEPVVPDAPTAPVGGTYESPFADDQLVEHVDLFWSRAFAEAGLAYDPPDGVVGFSVPIDTGCGPASPVNDAAFYCVLDETIYYAQEFHDVIFGIVGDFGWITVVSHEWGHHVQSELGIFASVTPELDGGFYTIELELQADCLAGAYTRDAEARSWLHPGDVEEALILTDVAGDPTGIAWYDPNAHGSSELRLAFFHGGYEGGIPACGLEL